MHDSDISPLTRLVARLTAHLDAAKPEVTPGGAAGVAGGVTVGGAAGGAAGGTLLVPAERSGDRVRTHFASVDQALGGGLRLGELAVLGGDVGAGCSALALAFAVRTDARTLLLSTEQAVERMHERVLAAEAQVPLEALRLGLVNEDDHMRLAAAALSLRERMPVVDTLLHGGLDAVERALDASPDTQLLVVDSLDGLLDRDHAIDEALAYAVLWLKRLALARRVAILLTTHLPALERNRRDRRPQLVDFGLRGAIGLHADVVLGLYREELYEADLGVAGAAELSVLKQRDGAAGYVDLYFDARYAAFSDLMDG